MTVAALATPDVAFILLLVGIYALLIEIAHPGAVVPALTGIVCLVLAAVALSDLPLQYGALALLLAGIALMVGEAMTPGLGVLGILGLAAFVVGAYYLFDAPAGDLEMRVSLPLIVGSALASAGITIFILGAAFKAAKRPPAAGAEELLTERGTVIDWQGDSGQVRVHGEVWAARAAAAFRPGDPVRVAGRNGLILTVEPA